MSKFEKDYAKDMNKATLNARLAEESQKVKNAITKSLVQAKEYAKTMDVSEILSNPEGPQGPDYQYKFRKTGGLNMDPPDPLTRFHKTLDTSKTYMGHIIEKRGPRQWEVVAYGKIFTSLKKARDWVKKHVGGTVKVNGPCARVMTRGKKCNGTIKASRGKYKCSKCKAEYREA